MKEKFFVTISIEEQSSVKLSNILETVELGRFDSEEDARDAFEEILETAGLEPVDDPEVDNT